MNRPLWCALPCRGVLSYLQLVGEQHRAVDTHMAGFLTLLTQLQQGHLANMDREEGVSTAATCSIPCTLPSSDTDQLQMPLYNKLSIPKPHKRLAARACCQHGALLFDDAYTAAGVAFRPRRWQCGCAWQSAAPSFPWTAGS